MLMSPWAPLVALLAEIAASIKAGCDALVLSMPGLVYAPCACTATDVDRAAARDRGMTREGGAPLSRLVGMLRGTAIGADSAPAMRTNDVSFDMGDAAVATGASAGAGPGSLDKTPVNMRDIQLRFVVIV